MEDDPHVALKQLRSKLRGIYETASNYRPPICRPPVIYSSTTKAEPGRDTIEDDAYGVQRDIPGLNKLKESIRIDLDILEKFLDDPESNRRTPLTTNAPYLVAVWNEFICAPAPVEAIFQFVPLDGLSITSAARRQRAVHGNNNTVKVDIVADGGKSWVRINTVKNSRLFAEFREIDSYLTDSDDDDDCAEDARPSLAQSEFDNSVLRMGRALIAAAKANPIEGTGGAPKVTLRLTRLHPSPTTESDGDVRIAKTIQLLRDMGIHVMLGERKDDELSTTHIVPNPAPVFPVRPLSLTPDINLDLSALIALVSDITHAPLPANAAEANKWFIPPDSYREWKKTKKKSAKLNVGQVENPDTDSLAEAPEDYEKHSRALTHQLLQEMERGLLQEIHDKTSSILRLTSGKNIRFWTTVEARDRCLRIIAKIGGPNERRRAHALFWTVSTLSTQGLAITEAEEMYWEGSRYGRKFISLFPIHLYPETRTQSPDLSLVPLTGSKQKQSQFFKELVRVCERIVAQDTVPHRRNFPPPDEELKDHQLLSGARDIQRADVMKANPRLTAHTVQGLLRGAERGWTTLTANRSSVKVILREMKLFGIFDDHSEIQQGDSLREDAPSHTAAIWVVNPRSLAEGMSSQSFTR